MKFPLVLGLVSLCLALATPALAQTSAYAEVNIAGTFNGWNTETNKLRLIANNTWQGDFTITSNSFEFKFTIPGWGANWGDNNPPNTSPPISGTGESGGANILVTNNTENVFYRFTINTSTREYAAFLLNNIGTNLLFNGGFEIQGSDWYVARSWEQNNPNLHGNRIGSADRSDYGGGHDSTWKGQILGAGLGIGSGSFWQEAPVEMGIPYRAAAWFEAETLDWTSGVQELRLEFYDFNKTSLLASATRDLSTVSTLWEEYSITSAAPAQAAWARLVFNVSGAGSNGTLRMDDADITAMSDLRSEDFNAWGYAGTDDCYLRAGWIVCTGQTVSTTVFGGNEVPLARSGYAASLSNPGGVTNGSYILTPRLADGIGTISFWYRHSLVDTNSEPSGPVSLVVQLSFLGDVWTNVAEIGNIYSTSYRQFSMFVYEPGYRYVRLMHAGGSTNRVFIDDVSIAVPVEAARLMDFNAWPDSGTNEGTHTYVQWQVATGIVSATDAKEGKAGHIYGAETLTNFLRSPKFSDGFGDVTFSARISPFSARTAGVGVDSSPDGTNWTMLTTMPNLDSATWQDFSLSFFQPAPGFVRLRNIPETNLSDVATIRITEPFDNGATPPAGWTFEDIGQYDSDDSSGESKPSLKFQSTNSYVITASFARPTNAQFMTKGNTIDPASTFTVQGMIGTNWTTITVFTNLTNSKTNRTVALSTNVTALKFLYGKVSGNLAFDDLLVIGPRQVVGEQPPQTIIFDNVNIAAPVENRVQDFNSWPQKMDFTGGTTQHQNWVLGGNSKVGATKAYAGQSLQLSRAAQSSDYYVDCEGAAEFTGDTYASNNVTLSDIPWVFINSITGPQPSGTNDWYIGTRAMRLRGYGTSSVTMVANKIGGLGTISFQYRRYGTDSQGDWMVQYSINNGTNWTQAGASFTAPSSTNVTTFTATVNVTNAARVRIKRATETGASNKRLNIDNILMSGYGGTGGASDAFVKSQYLPDGIGPITFQYRHWMDSAPATDAVIQARIQTSSNGVTWTTAATLMISNVSYRLCDTYVSLTNHFYARLLIDQGNSIALFDDIAIARPQARANVRITGWHDPANPYTNDWVALKAQVFTEYGARSVAVTSYYRIGTAGTWRALAMTTDGDTYTAVSNIPPQPVSTVVQYYVRASFEGPGSDTTSPVYYPTNYATSPAWYGIPRNPPGRVWINEIDYDAWDWFDNYEFVELAGVAGVNISGWKIELRDGNATNMPLFDSYTLAPGTTLPNDTNGFGFYVLGETNLPSPPRDLSLTNYLSSHVPGAVRLLNEMGGVEAALSYGGTVPAHSRIPVDDYEAGFGFDPPTNAVVLTGVGTIYAHFEWGNRGQTPGAGNPDQVFANPATIVASPTNLVFSYIAGSYSPAEQSLVISNSGASLLTYGMTTNVSWLTVTPNTGIDLVPSGTVTHAVAANTDGLTGNQSAEITIEGNAGNSPVTVPVALNEVAIGSAILDYPLNNSLLNQGTAGSEGHLSVDTNLTWTPNGGGVSGTAGDYGLISADSNSHARTTGAVASVSSLAQFTITGWIKTSHTGGTHRLFGNRMATNGFALLTSSNYQNLALVSSATGSPAAVTSTNGTLANGTWQFFAVTFDATNAGAAAVRFYRGAVGSGVYQFSTRARGGLGATGVSTGQFFVAGDGVNSFQGEVDALKFYSGVKDLMTIEAIRRQDVDTGGEPLVPPTITQQPTGATQAYFTILSIGVSATATPEPEYQWRKGGIPLPGEEGNGLLFNPLMEEDAGSYDVIVSNLAGWVVSSSAVVVVLAPPEILQQPTGIVVYIGETVNFSVTATGTPTMLYQWLYGGAPMGGETNSRLTLVGVQTNQAGSYRVDLTNRVAYSNSAVAVLTVKTLNMSEGGWIRQPPDGQGFVVYWPTISNRWYEIWWSSNLMMGVEGFVPVNTTLQSIVGANFITYTDATHAAGGRGFYQIRSRTDP